MKLEFKKEKTHLTNLRCVSWDSWTYERVMAQLSEANHSKSPNKSLSDGSLSWIQKEINKYKNMKQVENCEQNTGVA